MLPSPLLSDRRRLVNGAFAERNNFERPMHVRLHHGVLSSIDRWASGGDTCPAMVWIGLESVIRRRCSRASAASTTPDFSPVWRALPDANSSSARSFRRAPMRATRQNGGWDPTGRSRAQRSPRTHRAHRQSNDAREHGRSTGCGPYARSLIHCEIIVTNAQWQLSPRG
jgi:hypothetical protein